MAYDGLDAALTAAGVLSILIGAAHSVLGERLVLGPLFARGEVPKLLGSRAFAQQTLRFTWHITTLLLVAIGSIVVFLAATPAAPATTWVLKALAITFAASSLISLTSARGRHFSWWVFLLIAILLWIGAR